MGIEKARNKNRQWLLVARLFLSICFGIAGIFFLFAAFIVFAEIVEEVSVREPDVKEVEVLIIGSFLLTITIFWFVFLSRAFNKDQRPIIKLMIIGLLFLPVILHQILSVLGDFLEFWSYEYKLVELGQFLIMAGFWLGFCWLTLVFKIWEKQ